MSGAHEVVFTTKKNCFCQILRRSHFHDVKQTTGDVVGVYPLIVVENVEIIVIYQAL